MAASRVGVVLRGQYVDVVEAKKSGRGVAVVKQARVPVEGADDAQMVAAIQAAMAQAGLKPGPVYVAVPAPDVLLRSFALPSLPRSEWPTAIQFEARKYIPFKTEELVWGFHAAEDKTTKQLNVMFAGIRSEVFAKVKGWVDAAGLKPMCIEAPWLSLARLGTWLKVVPEHYYAIVEVEPHVAHLVIAKDEVPYLARNINLSAPAQDAGEGRQVKDPRAEKLLTELRLSMDFFGCEHPSATMSQVILLGDEATMSAWAPWLGEQLPCPVVPARMPLDAQSQAIGSDLALALGLTLRDLHPARVRMDFLERSGAQPARTGALGGLALDMAQLEPLIPFAKAAAWQAALAALAIAGLAALGNQRVASVRQQVALAALSTTPVGWNLEQKPRAELDALQVQLSAFEPPLRALVEQRVGLTEKLDSLARRLPDGVWLEDIHFETTSMGDETVRALVLKGACYQPAGGELELINEFVNQLKDEPKFFRGFGKARLGQVASASIRDGDVRYQTFQIRCESERKL